MYSEMTVSELEQDLLNRVSGDGDIRFMSDHYLTYDHEKGLVVKNLLNTKIYPFRQIYSRLYKDLCGIELYESILRIRRALNIYYSITTIEEQYY